MQKWTAVALVVLVRYALQLLSTQFSAHWRVLLKLYLCMKPEYRSNLPIAVQVATMTISNHNTHLHSQLACRGSKKTSATFRLTLQSFDSPKSATTSSSNFGPKHPVRTIGFDLLT